MSGWLIFSASDLFRTCPCSPACDQRLPALVQVLSALPEGKARICYPTPRSFVFVEQNSELTREEFRD